MNINIDSFIRGTIDHKLSVLKAFLEECGLTVELGKLGPPETRSKHVGPAISSSRKTAAEPRSIQVSNRYDSLVVSIVYSPARERFELFAYEPSRRPYGRGAERLYERCPIETERVESNLEPKVYSMVEKYLLSPARPSRTL